MTQRLRFKRVYATFRNKKQRDDFLEELNQLCVKYEKLGKGIQIGYDWDEE